MMLSTGYICYIWLPCSNETVQPHLRMRRVQSHTRSTNISALPSLTEYLKQWFNKRTCAHFSLGSSMIFSYLQIFVSGRATVPTVPIVPMTHIENAPARKAIPTCSSWCVVLSMSSVVQSCCSSSSCRSKISKTLRPPSSSNSLVHAVLDNKLLSMISSKVSPRSALSGTPSGRIFCSVSSVWEVLAIQSSRALRARSQSSIAWKGHKGHTGKGLFCTFNIVTCDIDDMSDMSDML